MSKFDDRGDEKFYATIIEVCVGIILILVAWAFIFGTGGCGTNALMKDCEWYCPINGEIPQDCYCIGDIEERRRGK